MPFHGEYSLKISELSTCNIEMEKNLELPLKTDSFKIWAEKLVEYANSKSFLEEKAYWAELESHAIEPVKKDFEEAVQ